MKNKFKLICALAITSLACVFGAACAEKTVVDDYAAQGYTIQITYDANGGNFLERTGVTIMDLFNPDRYTADSNGNVNIQLLEPTDPERNGGTGVDKVTLTKTGYFFAGWYSNRTIVTNAQGEVLDDNGNVITLVEGSENEYVNKEGTSAHPAYTYSGYWDFANDRVTYEADSEEVYSLTLYAGWVPYYEFDYYRQVNGVWEQFATTSYDYKTTNAEGSKTFDKDVIWVPDWSEGAMNYTYKYNNNESFNFPKVDGTTFMAAYLDEACTQPIAESLEHQGNLIADYGTDGELKVENRVQNVYVVLDEEGEKYRIETAQQFANNANVKGIYEVLVPELDFAGLTWPAAFVNNKFEGKIFGTDNMDVTFKNVSASLTVSSSTTIGGLFGTIGKSATITNVKFVNASFDMASGNNRSSESYFGLLTGNIEDGASVEGVYVDGTFKLGTISFSSGYNFHLVANGDLSGVSSGNITLRIYGQNLFSYYNFTIYDPANVETDGDGVTVDSDGEISLKFVSSYKSVDNEYYETTYSINGGNN